MAIGKSSPVAVVGAGAWGLSTTLHLVQSGYTDVTEAIERWKTPLFGPNLHVHQTGYINCTSGRAPQRSVDTLAKNFASVSCLPTFANEIRILREKKGFNNVAWQLTGELTGFNGYFNRLAGYAHSGNTLARVQAFCALKGVRFLLGERVGKVEAFIYNVCGRCTGVRTADGSTHDAVVTICALGANAATLVPSIGKFAIARCWSVVHIQLTEDEVNLLRGIPVVNVRDLGFFFEPDPHTRLLKLCPLGGGYTNTGVDGVSLPPGSVSEPGWGGFVPPDDERKLRALLREVLPWLADRPFVDNKFCWFSDTPDSEDCIDFVPGSSNSLVVLAGDSGHGFKMMPTVGKWVLELLDAGRQALPRWQWKSNQGKAAWEGGVSWRVGNSKEMRDLIGE